MTLVAVVAVTALAALAAGAANSAGVKTSAQAKSPVQKAVFFAADGMRQDIVARYAAQGLMPTMSDFLKKGTSASGNGLLTQAPPNTGAGWYSLATGAWPGVHGSTNNTFHRNGQPFANRTAAFDPGVLQAESIAQSAERSGLKVAQVEWAGGRNATIGGPTIDFQSFFSGRGVATNFIGKAGEPLFDNAANIAAFGLQFDHPAGYAGQAAYAGAEPTPAVGWTGVASPDVQLRARDASPRDRLRRRQVRAERLDLRLDERRKVELRQGALLEDEERRGRRRHAQEGRVGGRQGQDRRRRLCRPDGGNARQGRGADARPLARPALPHVGQPRDRIVAELARRVGFSGDFAEYLAQKFPTSTAADFAILEAGVTSEETYTEQGLYWKTGHLPMLEYVVKTYKPDLLLAGMPTTDEFQHQFLGLVSPKLPGGAANPAYDDVDLNGKPDGRVAAREGFIRTAYEEADEVLTRARELMGKDPTTFVGSDHGFAPQFLAIDASLPLVEMGLLSRPQTSNCRPGDGRDHRQGQGLLGRRDRPDLPEPRRPRPRGGGLQQVAAADAASTVAAIKAKYQGLVDTKDWTHDGQPEGWKMIDRVFTKAEARYIPNGPNSTADMAHPTRAGDVIAFSYPPYQFDAETPGTLVAPSQFFGQHGYVPAVQDLPANINMRATFLAGGEGIAKGEVSARTIDLAPTLAFLLGIAEPQQSQGRVLLDVVKGGEGVQADLGHRAERLPRPARADDPGDHALRRHRPERRRRRLPRDAVRRGLRGAAEAGPPAGRW